MAYQKVQSVIRALKIMELLREKSLRNEFVSPSEAAEAAGTSRITAYNILNTLAECGYVRHTARGRYEEGSRGSLLVLGTGITPLLREAARPLMEQAAAVGRESFVLATLHNARRVELLRIGRIKNTRSATFEANEKLYSMRTTRVMLAWYKQHQLDYFIRHNGLPQIRDWQETNGTRNGLKTELARIRENGGCNDIHESVKLAVVAVPVFFGNEIIASLGCYSPVNQTSSERQKGIFWLLQDCAEKINQTLLKMPGLPQNSV